jgi:hypothetical protein
VPGTGGHGRGRRVGRGPNSPAGVPLACHFHRKTGVSDGLRWTPEMATYLEFRLFAPARQLPAERIPKLRTRVRFPSPAPTEGPRQGPVRKCSQRLGPYLGCVPLPCHFTASIGLGEDRLDGGDHHVGAVPLHPGQHIAHEMDPAPLPSRPHQKPRQCVTPLDDGTYRWVHQKRYRWQPGEQSTDTDAFTPATRTTIRHRAQSSMAVRTVHTGWLRFILTHFSRSTGARPSMPSGRRWRAWAGRSGPADW